MANMLDHAGRRLLSSGLRFDRLGQTQSHPRLTGTVTVGTLMIPWVRKNLTGWKQGHNPVSFRSPCLWRGLLFDLSYPQGQWIKTLPGARKSRSWHHP